MHKPPFSTMETEPLTTAIAALQELLFDHSLRWSDPTAVSWYSVVDAALDVARQILAGDLAPSQHLAQALNTALLDETPLPWSAIPTVSA